MALRINLKNILKKVNNFLNSNKTKETIVGIEEEAFLGGEQPVNGYIHTADEVYYKFRQVLIDSILSSGVPTNVAWAIIDGLTGIEVKHLGDGKFIISIGFDGSLTRESLDPSSYPEGIDDLGALYNDGVGHEMKPVYGYWHGRYTRSRTKIPGYGYYESARSKFMSDYADEYNVVEIRIDPYKY